MVHTFADRRYGTKWQISLCLHMTIMRNDLDAILDGQLTMARHISSVCNAGFFQQRQLRSVRRSLTTEATRTLVQAFISCRLDYCNSLLARVADVYLRRLQRCADPRYHSFEVLYCARYHGVWRGRATGAASPRLGRSMQLMHAMELRTWL